MCKNSVLRQWGGKYNSIRRRGESAIKSADYEERQLNGKVQQSTTPEDIAEEKVQTSLSTRTVARIGKVQQAEEAPYYTEDQEAACHPTEGKP